VNDDLSVLGDLAEDWPELKTMGIVVSIRHESEVAKEKEVSVRYYISSKELDAKTLLTSVRSHWKVESMHWLLDTAFSEDASRIRAEDRAESFARIRQVCLNLLKSERTFKASIKRKRNMCALDENYLLKGRYWGALANGNVHDFSVSNGLEAVGRGRFARGFQVFFLPDILD